jgi:hypothetical protein
VITVLTGAPMLDPQRNAHRAQIEQKFGLAQALIANRVAKLGSAPNECNSALFFLPPFTRVSVHLVRVDPGRVASAVKKKTSADDLLAKFHAELLVQMLLGAAGFPPYDIEHGPNLPGPGSLAAVWLLSAQATLTPEQKKLAKDALIRVGAEALPLNHGPNIPNIDANELVLVVVSQG